RGGTAIPLGHALLRGSSDLPGGLRALHRRPKTLAGGKAGAPSRHASRRSGSFLPIWSCSVWGLPCPQHYCCGGALLPHLFTLTPRCGAVYFLWHFPSTSLDAGLPDVIRHTALWSSDFPPPSLAAMRAAVRSSCLHTYYS